MEEVGGRTPFYVVPHDDRITCGMNDEGTEGIWRSVSASFEAQVIQS